MDPVDLGTLRPELDFTGDLTGLDDDEFPDGILWSSIVFVSGCPNA